MAFGDEAMRIIILARPVKHGALVKGGRGRKSDRVIELSRAQKLAAEGRLVPVNIEVEVETSAGKMTVPVFRDAKKFNGSLRGLSARMSGPGYVELLGQATSKSAKKNAKAESVLEAWKGDRNGAQPAN
jgi:hypothetical protein